MNAVACPPRARWWHLAMTGATATLLCMVCTESRASEGRGPHWQTGGCTACHDVSEPSSSDPALKTTPAYRVCYECHDAGQAAVCRHRSDFNPGETRATEFDKGLRAGLHEGTIVCTTCHDMAPHCALDAKQRYRNRSFLRGGPFPDSSDECFGCHQKSAYRQRSPHMHLRRGEISEDKCIFCHGSMPQRTTNGQWLEPVPFATAEPLAKLCDGCHRVGPHPSSSVTGKKGWMHMIVPSPTYAARMQESVAARGGRLPLDPRTGEITCATCHNPHDPGLPGYPSAGEEDTEARLRYAKICGVCHDK